MAYIFDPSWRVDTHFPSLPPYRCLNRWINLVLFDVNNYLQSAIKDPKDVQIMTWVIVERKGFRDDILLLTKCTRVDRH